MDKPEKTTAAPKKKAAVRKPRREPGIAVTHLDAHTVSLLLALKNDLKKDNA